MWEKDRWQKFIFGYISSKIWTDFEPALFTSNGGRIMYIFVAKLFLNKIDFSRLESKNGGNKTVLTATS